MTYHPTGIEHPRPVRPIMLTTPQFNGVRPPATGATTIPPMDGFGSRPIFAPAPTIYLGVDPWTGAPTSTRTASLPTCHMHVPRPASPVAFTPPLPIRGYPSAQALFSPVILPTPPVNPVPFSASLQATYGPALDDTLAFGTGCYAYPHLLSPVTVRTLPYPRPVFGATHRPIQAHAQQITVPNSSVVAQQRVETDTATESKKRRREERDSDAVALKTQLHPPEMPSIDAPVEVVPEDKQASVDRVSKLIQEAGYAAQIQKLTTNTLLPLSINRHDHIILRAAGLFKHMVSFLGRWPTNRADAIQMLLNLSKNPENVAAFQSNPGIIQKLYQCWQANIERKSSREPSEEENRHIENILSALSVHPALASICRDQEGYYRQTTTIQEFPRLATPARR